MDRRWNEQGRSPRVEYPEITDQAASDGSLRVLGVLYKLLEIEQKKCSNGVAECKSLVESLDRTRKMWQSSASENAILKERFQSLQNESEEKDRKIRTLSAQLNDARTQAIYLTFVGKQLGEINALRADLDENVTRMDLIKQVLKDQINRLSADERQQLAFLREPGLIRSHSRAYAAKRCGVTAYVEEDETEEDDDGVDYDRTEDDIEEEEEAHTRSGRVFRRSSASQSFNNRRSASAHAAMISHNQKRSRSRVCPTVEEEQIVEGETKKKRSRDGSVNLTSTNTEVTTTIIVDDQGASGMRPSRASRTKVTISRSMNRSMSESNITEQKTTPGSAYSNAPRTTSTLDLRTPTRIADSWTKGSTISSRPHKFERLSSFFKMTSCDVCNGSINFTARPAVRCTDCNQHAHVSCKHRLTVPCVPKSATPRTPSRSRLAPKLQEFCPPTAPMIPAPIIHCVVALEKKNLDYPGIYRVPGRKDQVTRVLNELRQSRAVPKLELQDIEVITDCIKRFLIELRDPLIPKTSREEFVRAAKDGNLNALHQAIVDLPQPNRDTLAFLIIHWHKVASRSAFNKMPLENLARVLGPTVVGYTNHNFAAMNNGNAADETVKQQIVLNAILGLETAYWEQFLAYENDAARGKAATPVSTAARTLPPQALTPSARAYTTAARLQFDSSDPAAVDQSLLGPISHSPSKQSAGPAPPLIRGTNGQQLQARKFFASPFADLP